jgi:AraC family transcriptional regulator
MPHRRILADRGETLVLDALTADRAGSWTAVSRMASLRTSGPAFTLWVQVRGTTRVSAREGQFVLRPGEWLALDRDSAPDLQAGRHGLTVGLVLAPDGQGAGRRGDLLPGRGHMALRDLRAMLKLWRTGVRSRDGEAQLQAMLALQHHAQGLQRELDSAIARSPGRSPRRKRQVFGRMQRARLFLDGHRDRVVRLTELASLTAFSSWYLSKTFHEIYDESPQAASARLRLERACELLATTDLSIGEIGSACGFDNNCSFARAFRMRFGTTATAYRAAARREQAGRRAGQGAAAPAMLPRALQHAAMR